MSGAIVVSAMSHCPLNPNSFRQVFGHILQRRIASFAAVAESSPRRSRAASSSWRAVRSSLFDFGQARAHLFGLELAANRRAPRRHCVRLRAQAAVRRVCRFSSSRCAISAEADSICVCRAVARSRISDDDGFDALQHARLRSDGVLQAWPRERGAAKLFAQPDRGADAARPADRARQPAAASSCARVSSIAAQFGLPCSDERFLLLPFRRQPLQLAPA